MATARTLDQIIAELNPTYQAQTNSLQKQIGLIPQEIQTQETALNAQKDQGYADILSGARRRGTGVAFGGIPLGEQAKYNATIYTPALANLRMQGQQKAMSLQDAILGINERRDTAAQSIYQTEQDRAFQEQENARNRAATAASVFNPTNFADYFTQPSNTTIAESKPYYDTAALNAGKGFNFYDGVGQPIRAFTFSQMTGQNFRSLLSDMAKKGDNNAKIALKYVGGDGKYVNADASAKNALDAVGATGTIKKSTSPFAINDLEKGMLKLFGAPDPSTWRAK